MAGARRKQDGRLKVWLITTLIPPLLKLWHWTWRVEHVDAPAELDPSARSLFAHWHGENVFLLCEFRDRGVGIMVSKSRDGDLMDRALRKLGYRTVRGSTSRGGAAALKALIEAARDDDIEVALSVDGPRGPAYIVKKGILKLAQATGKPILPAGTAARRRKVFKAWDFCYLPCPFTRGVICWGAPIRVPEDADAEAVEEIRQRLQAEMRRLKIKAEATFGRSWDPRSPDEIAAAPLASEEPEQRAVDAPRETSA